MCRGNRLDTSRLATAARGRAWQLLRACGRLPGHDLLRPDHAEKAEVLATYQNDFYAGQPALTVSRLGDGRCLYLAARPADDTLHDAVVRGLVRRLGLTRALDVELPEGTTIQMRSGDGQVFLFLHNFRREARLIDLKTHKLRDLVTGEVLTGHLPLPAFASRVLVKA